MNYGAILRACRDRAGLSQEELAHRLNINQSDISKYERGRKEPVLSLLQSWTTHTQSQEVMVAFLCGVDGLSTMQTIFESLPTVVGMILGVMM